ncbi:hypothetical protein GALMADRAFT_247259 [Galerina marginata CBS 339.88]|uniref:Uncharacterized protein n=1 Tax=Galerina marginata (strain CBS 339.88) TaxID=685588 RepID=A0A067SYX6_GALM3|nr:hypothetical protein GALMADRAFT_247259 [Galerina marginata CBS 339.88]
MSYHIDPRYYSLSLETMVPGLFIPSHSLVPLSVYRFVYLMPPYYIHIKCKF